MTKPHDFHPEDQDFNEFDPGAPGADVPVEDDLLEEAEQPRRAASAQFIVHAEMGSDAALREAMDPANQSLADALRLSFRVLQFVMLVLVVLFFASGFQTVGEGQRGVLTRWGRIVPIGESTVLEPGLKFSRWPYPIGEFVIFDVDNRQVTLSEAFWPRMEATQTLEQATESAAVHRPPIPGTDGYVLTRDGDIAHLRVNATYQIDNPVDFVERIAESRASRLVSLALQRATIQVSATLSLQELIDLSEVVRTEIHERAQRILDEMRCGVHIANVSVADAIPALAIRRAYGNLQNARVEADQAREQAADRAHQTLVRTAGANREHTVMLLDLIAAFEEAHSAGDDERSEALLAEISSTIDRGVQNGHLSGEVASVIHRAHAYRSQIESSLGNEARRFASLRPAFRSHPEMVIRQRWLEAYANVLSREDAEVWFVPRHVGLVRLDLSGLHHVRELRRDLNMDRRESEALRSFSEQMGGPYLLQAEDMVISGPGRQLRIDEEGRVRSLRRD